MRFTALIIALVGSGLVFITAPIGGGAALVAGAIAFTFLLPAAMLITTTLRDLL